jgi:hypothetical protein
LSVTVAMRQTYPVTIGTGAPSGSLTFIWPRQ